MDGPRYYYTNGRKSDKDKYDITYIMNLKKDTNELIYRLRDIENTLWLPKGKGRRDKLGIWD